MLKKILTRALISAPAGMLVHQLIALIVSAILGEGRFMPVTPAFAAKFASETAAVAVQLGLIGLVSAVFAGCSVIFEIPRWGLLQQAGLHLLITSAALIPVCLYCWFPENGLALGILLGCWLFTYAATWIPQYFLNRRQVRELNEKIKAVNGGTENERH